MTQLMNINRQCYEKLASLDPKLWCKSHFTFLAKSDMLMNNISEAFNGRILEARDKPIITMFEWIRCYWMSRCRFWGLCGMPCPHACCAIFEKGDNPEDYCSNFYSPAAYVATYGNLVSPINGENMWSKVECDTIIPPIFRVKPGRPRMVRIREPDENRSQTNLRKMGSSVTCSNCGQYGHNRRHCSNPIVSGIMQI
ncbi:uncharacterized protein [Arachis hypogaea]|uniref:uncharacterized protein n=1 Tax=Arachis hypogaea TaxID=3818 RepID=UPI003B22090B